MDPSLMKVNWMGEDWIGLRQEVTKSDLANKKEILEDLGYSRYKQAQG